MTRIILNLKSILFILSLVHLSCGNEYQKKIPFISKKEETKLVEAAPSELEVYQGTLLLRSDITNLSESDTLVIEHGIKRYHVEIRLFKDGRFLVIFINSSDQFFSGQYYSSEDKKLHFDIQRSTLLEEFPINRILSFTKFQEPRTGKFSLINDTIEFQLQKFEDHIISQGGFSYFKTWHCPINDQIFIFHLEEPDHFMARVIHKHRSHILTAAGQLTWQKNLPTEEGLVIFFNRDGETYQFEEATPFERTPIPSLKLNATVGDRSFSLKCRTIDGK